MTPTITPEAARLAEERQRFEAYIRKDCGDLSTFGRGENMHYLNSAVNNAWLGWLERSKQDAAPTSASTVPEWINVQDRLPEVDERCLYYFDVVGIHVGEYHGAGNFGGRSGFLGGQEVTHWMPLPAPPGACSVTDGEA